MKESALGALQELEQGNVLLWDRLGGGGRQKRKTAQHFNKEVRSAYKDMGVRIVYLPRKCPYLNLTAVFQPDV
jgi:hypothetical protein